MHYKKKEIVLPIFFSLGLAIIQPWLTVSGKVSLETDAGQLATYVREHMIKIIIELPARLISLGCFSTA